MERAVRAALALGSDEAVREALEQVATRPYFSAFTWLWAPALARRNRVMFRPFILSLFGREALDGKGDAFDPWRGPTAGPLQALLDEADAADDIELTRRLYGWKLAGRRDGDAWWRGDVVRRFRAAGSPAARHAALAKADPGSRELDPASALALWQIDRAAARRFLLAHLPWRPSRTAWQPLLDASHDDPEFHFELYRKAADPASWRADVLALPATPEIAAELERRHPAMWDLAPAEVFHDLLESHGDAAVPYVKRHTASIRPGPAGSDRELSRLLALAIGRGWLDLWAALLRTSATRERFDAEVRALVRAGDRALLALIPGRGREFHGAGWSFATTQALTDATACALYAAYPDLVRGPYRVHITPQWSESYPELARAAIAAGDGDLVDTLASRVVVVPGHGASGTAAIEVLAAHYAALPEATFVTRAANALSRIPALTIWSYRGLVDGNRLARLLFEHAPARYLADGAAVRDLLESPQIHVQRLGFRALAGDDPRAVAIAAACVDLLQATLLRRMRAADRRPALAALRAAARHDEATARTLLARMRDALALPDRHYPVEDLVGVIASVLHHWPALRGAREQPVVYGAEAT